MDERHMSEQINVEEIMEELRKTAHRRQYDREAPEFDSVVQENMGHIAPFHMRAFRRETEQFRENCYVEYDIPIEGRGGAIKRLIRKLYRFHLKPLFDRQNDVNLSERILWDQLESFIAESLQEREQMQQEIAELKRRLEQMEKHEKKHAKKHTEMNL